MIRCASSLAVVDETLSPCACVAVCQFVSVCVCVCVQ